MTFPPGKVYSDGFEAISYIGLQDRPGFKMALHKHGELRMSGCRKRSVIFYRPTL